MKGLRLQKIGLLLAILMAVFMAGCAVQGPAGPVGPAGPAGAEGPPGGLGPIGPTGEDGASLWVDPHEVDVEMRCGDITPNPTISARAFNNDGTINIWGVKPEYDCDTIYLIPDLQSEWGDAGVTVGSAYFYNQASSKGWERSDITAHWKRVPDDGRWGVIVRMGSIDGVWGKKVWKGSDPNGMIEFKITIDVPK